MVFYFILIVCCIKCERTVQDTLYNFPIPNYTELHVLYSIYILLFLLFIVSFLNFLQSTN